MKMKCLCIIVLCFVLIPFNIAAKMQDKTGDYELRDNEIFVKTDAGFIQLTNDGKEKNEIGISPDKKILVYNDKDFQNKQVGEHSENIVVMDMLTKEKIKVLEIRELFLQVIDEYVWLYNNVLGIIGHLAGDPTSNQALLVFNFTKDKLNFEFGGRNISFSPRKNRIISLSWMPFRTPEDLASDRVVAVDTDFIYSLNEQSIKEKKYIRVLYPIKGQTNDIKFDKLEDRHFIISEFLWLNNDTVAFIDNYDNSSHLILITFKKYVDDFDVKITKLANYYTQIDSFVQNNSQIMIKGNRYIEKKGFIEMKEAVTWE